MLVGLVLYELLLARLKPDEFERSILITLGLSIIIIHVMQYLFTATPRMVDTQYGFEGVSDRLHPHHLDAHHRRRRRRSPPSAASTSCCATPSSAAPCAPSPRTARPP